MKLNNKGFALTSIIYMLIVLFLIIMLLVLSNLASRKVVLDKLKNDLKIKLNQTTSTNSEDLPYQNINTKIYYENLEVALLDAQTDETIKVLKNVQDISNPTLDENKNVKIDLAGKEISLINELSNKGTLDIYSSVDDGKIISTNLISIRNYGTFSLNGTSSEHTLTIVNSTITKPSGVAILVNGSGTSTLNNNVIMKYDKNATSGDANRYIATNAGTIIVNGANIINNMDGLTTEHGITNSTTATNGSIIFNSGTIETSGIALYNNGSTKNTIENPAIKIAGGTIKSSANVAVYNEPTNGMTYITGGEISSTGNYTVNNKGKLNMTGGTIHDYYSVGLNTTGNGNSIVSGGLIVKEKNPITDTWMSGANFQIGSSANATIKGNAVVRNELGNSSNVIYNSGSGTLTVEENATIENKGAALLGTNNNKGKIVINGGTLESNGKSVLRNGYSSSTSTNYGTIEVNGGSLSTTTDPVIMNSSNYGQIKVTGGTLTTTGYTAIKNEKASSVIDISGGSITAETANGSYGTIYNNQATTTIGITGGLITSGTTSSGGFTIYNANGSTNSSITMTGGELSTKGATAIYNRGNGATVTIGTLGATDNTYPKIAGKIWGDGETDGTGLITVNSGTITGTTQQAIHSKNDITVNGGVISASNLYGIITDNANSKITINGGTITSGNTYAVTTANAKGGDIEINGGTITRTTGSTAAVNNYLGNTVIKGGEIISPNGIGVYATTGTVTIGTDGGNPSQIEPSITGKTYGVQATSGTINFYDGKIIGKSGSGSAISGTVNPQSGYGLVTSLSGTTETVTLGQLRTITYDYNYMDDDIYGTKLVTANFSNATASGTTSKVDNTLAKYGKEARWTSTSDGKVGGPHMTPGRLTVGNTYTWSVYVKASKNITLNMGQEQNGRKQVNVTTDWQRFTNTFVAGDTQYNSFTFYAVSGKSVWNTGDILYVHSLEIKEVPTLNITTDTKPSGAQIGALPEPTRTDYSFDGWYTSPVGGTKITSSTIVPNSNTTYYARWIYNP